MQEQNSNRKNVLYAVNYVIVHNPTFLLSGNVAREVRGLIKYSLFSEYIIKWFENFLIPSMIKFNLTLTDLKQYFHSNIYRELLNIEKSTSEYAKVEYKLKQNLNEEEKRKALIQAAIFLARKEDAKMKLNKFIYVDKKTREKIDSLELINHNEKIKEELERIEKMDDHEINDEQKLVYFMTKNIREKFEELYKKIHESKLNVRSLIDQELVNEKLKAYGNLDKKTLNTIIESEKGSNRKKKQKEKKRETSGKKETLSQGELSQLLKHAHVRDETKDSVANELKISELEQLIKGLGTRIDNLKPHFTDAIKRRESEDPVIKIRGELHYNVYSQIKNNFEAEKILKEIELREALLTELL